MSTLQTIVAHSFPLLIGIGLISPLIALFSAIVFYVHHRERVEPGRRVPLVAFILALLLCAIGGGFFGLYIGLELACKTPNPGNLCGLWAFLVTGPILMALGIFLVGLGVNSMQPTRKA
jgi:MFS family permease